MKTLAILCAALCLVACEGRLSSDALRSALGRDAVFSHRRDKPAWQNVNVVLPVNDRDLIAVNPPTKDIATSTTTQAEPVMAESKVLGGTKGSVMKKQKRNNVRIAAKKPKRQPVVLGKKAQKPKKDVKARPATKPAITKKQKCFFQIPSILLPDPNPSPETVSQSCPSFLLPEPVLNTHLIDLLVDHWTGMTTPKSRTPVNKLRSQISQIDFEQKCLLPPLRAFVLGGDDCQTREHTVYLEWLIYLRQRLFNI